MFKQCQILQDLQRSSSPSILTLMRARIHAFISSCLFRFDPEDKKVSCTLRRIFIIFLSVFFQTPLCPEGNATISG
jgi:hypothetical protein